MHLPSAPKLLFAAVAFAFSLVNAVVRADDTCEQQPSGLFAGIQLQPVTDATFEPTSDPAMFRVRFGVSNQGDTELPVDNLQTLVRTGDPARRWYWRGAANAIFDEETGLAVTGFAPARTTIVEILLPASDFQRCSSLELTVDPFQWYQTACNAFADDSRLTPTPCLTWTTPFTAETLGTLDVYNALPATGPTASSLSSMTIEGIVSSWFIARPDGNPCSHCHFPSSREPVTYRPPEVRLDAPTFPAIQPDEIYAGRRWDDVNDGRGWALQFLGTTNPAKPRYLKLIFERWVRDGMRADPRAPVPPLRE